MDTLIPLIAILPIAGFLFTAAVGRRLGKRAHIVPVAAVALAWLIAMVVVFTALTGGFGDEGYAVKLWDWIPAGAFHIEAAFFVDNLTACLLIVVTTIGLLVHVYSIGYMSHDPGYWRFFAYLNLFMFSMLLLVLGDSWLTVFVAWELVGLSSYLLIGFWYRKNSAALASKKAFIVNRVGDVGFALGIMAIWVNTGTLNIRESIDVLTSQTFTTFPIPVAIVALLIFAGAMGKSAQFPLHVWLPDAMEGPTPVSALIHAATMVTAGVYLVVRSHAIFEGAPNAQLAVVVVGAITLLFGAIVGCAKDDMKKALAASTMSQIGYMMLAAGLGPVGYVFAIFHLLTHGFFKAGMFLGAGSVMHGMNDEVNMRRFGGLSAVMKITWVTFGLGWLAILGVPPFAGFWSKDKIIEAAFIGEGWRPWVFGMAALLGAGITAFYMSRLFFMTFHGKRRWSDDVHPHESPLTMTVPMMVLAVGSAVLGVVLGFGQTSLLQSWLDPVFGISGGAEHEPVLPPTVLLVLTLALVAGGIGLAWMRYLRDAVPVVAPQGNLVTRAARNDLYQDQVNEGVLMRPGTHLTRSLVFADSSGVDGAAGGLAALIGGTSSRLRRIQNGYARSYALTMLAGIVVLLGALWVIQ